MPLKFDVIDNRIFVGGQYVGRLDETLAPLMLDDVIESIRGLILHDRHMLAIWEAEDEKAEEDADKQAIYIEALEKQRELAEQTIKAHQAESAKLHADVEQARSWAVTTVNDLVRERDEARRYAEQLWRQSNA